MSGVPNSISASVRSVAKTWDAGAPAAASMRFQHPDLIIEPSRPEVDNIGRHVPYNSNVNVTAGSDPMYRINIETDLRFIDPFLPVHAGGVQPDNSDYYYNSDMFHLNRDQGYDGQDCMRDNSMNQQFVKQHFGGQCGDSCNCN